MKSASGGNCHRENALVQKSRAINHFTITPPFKRLSHREAIQLRLDLRDSCELGLHLLHEFRHLRADNAAISEE